MYTILITGVNGYIGSQIAEVLIRNNYNVIGIDLYSSNINKLINYNNFKFIKANIVDLNTIPDQIKKSNIVIHCAALVHKKSKDLSRNNYFNINFHGTENILYSLNRKKLMHIIFLSSVSVYGKQVNEAIPDEKYKPHPEDYYGESKLAAENLIIQYSKKFKIPYTIFRLTPVYGKNFLLNIYKRIYLPKKIAFYKLMSGEQQISLCSVNNVLDIIIKCILNKKFFYNIFILKDKQNYSVNNLIYFFKRHNKQNYKLIIKMPLFLLFIINMIRIIFPKKGKELLYNLSKITNNQIYSSHKLKHLNINPGWDIKKTFK